MKLRNLVKFVCLCAFIVGCSEPVGPTQLGEDFHPGTEARLAVLEMGGAIANLSQIYVGASTDLVVELRNTGAKEATNISTGQLVIVAPYSYKGGSFPGEGGTCKSSIPAGGKCNLIVTLTPTTVDAHPLILDLNYNNGRGIKNLSGSIHARGVRGQAGTLDPTFNRTGFVSHSVE